MRLAAEGNESHVSTAADGSLVAVAFGPVWALRAVPGLLRLPCSAATTTATTTTASTEPPAAPRAGRGGRGEGLREVVLKIGE
jgi:hypothetical protein